MVNQPDFVAELSEDLFDVLKFTLELVQLFKRALLPHRRRLAVLPAGKTGLDQFKDRLVPVERVIPGELIDLLQQAGIERKRTPHHHISSTSLEILFCLSC